VGHQSSLLLTLLAEFDLIKLIELFGFKEFLPDATILQKIAPGICDWVPHGCEDILFLLCGSSNNLNSSRIQVYVSETPAGTSVRNIEHWTQVVKSDKFQMFDFGCGLFSCENQRRYGQKEPPLYNLAHMTVPTALYYGDRDALADLKDVDKILNQIPNIVFSSREKSYAHLDYTWAVNANSVVYQSVLKLLNKTLTV
jgi:lysosomal acid lipase/cholesteryl ester hydrolase